jgi:hypothetical protein
MPRPRGAPVGAAVEIYRRQNPDRDRKRSITCQTPGEMACFCSGYDASEEGLWGVPPRLFILGLFMLFCLGSAHRGAYGRHDCRALGCPVLICSHQWRHCTHKCEFTTHGVGALY